MTTNRSITTDRTGRTAGYRIVGREFVLTRGGSRVERVVEEHTTLPNLNTLEELVFVRSNIVGSRSLFEESYTTFSPRIVRSFATFGHGSESTIEATIGIVATKDNSQLGIGVFVVSHYGTFVLYIEALHFQNRNVRTCIVSG